MSWQSLPAFLLAVGLLVTVHEFGHYWVARRLGFKVLRFSVGFGKALWSRTAGPDQTEYVIAAIPLGGYVKLLDEREGEVDESERHRAFTRRPHWQRILVLLAGPAMNILFAVLLLAGLFWKNGVNDVRPVVGTVLADTPAARAGMASGEEIIAMDGAPVAGQTDVVLELLNQMTGDGRAEITLRAEDGSQRQVVLEVADSAERLRATEPENLLQVVGFGFWLPPTPTVIGTIVPGGPAERAGLAAGDEILAVNGSAVTDFTVLAQRIAASPGQELVLTVRRSGEERSVPVTPEAVEDNGRQVGRLGIGAQSMPVPDSMRLHREVGPAAALAQGARESWRLTALQAKVLGSILVGHASVKNLSGPIGIMQAAGDSAKQGMSSFVSFLVLISLALGFLNLLPIPILDGGQVVFQVVEWIKGSPLSERAQVLGQQLGIALLVLLMGVALYNDISRQFG
jgi:regulator of sigma E protease